MHNHNPQTCLENHKRTVFSDKKEAAAIHGLVPTAHNVFCIHYPQLELEFGKTAVIFHLAKG